jgi:hypothetical protein
MVAPPVLHQEIYPAVDPTNFSNKGDVVLVIGTSEKFLEFEWG